MINGEGHRCDVKGEGRVVGCRSEDGRIHILREQTRHILAGHIEHRNNIVYMIFAVSLVDLERAIAVGIERKRVAVFKHSVVEANICVVASRKSILLIVILYLKRACAVGEVRKELGAGDAVLHRITPCDRVRVHYHSLLHGVPASRHVPRW